MTTRADPPAGLPPSPLRATLERWCREPYAIFFVEGVLLAWCGVLHWLLHACGLLPDYRGVFHSYAQIQGFLSCFALGFLFTALPRRTETAPPTLTQLSIGLATPPGVVLCAWLELWVAAQVLWLVWAAMLLHFLLRRFTDRAAGRRPPAGFLWIPLALLFGAVGSGSILVAELRGGDPYWLRELGRLALLQGTFLGLVLGAGSLVYPLLAHGQGPPDAAARDLRRLPLHALAAALLLGSFWLEVFVSMRGAYVLRALLLLALLGAGSVWRPPSVPGWHRRLIWLTPWMLPAGYLVGVWLPAAKKGALHLGLIGGFALMALTVGMHVALAHSGYQRALRGRSWRALLLGACLSGAAALRLVAELDRERFWLWIGTAAVAFLAGTGVWVQVVVPKLTIWGGVQRPAAEGS